MGKQIFSVNGMTRDISMSKFPNDKAFELVNMRITWDSDTETISLRNEANSILIQKESHTPVYPDIKGEVLGQCVINDYLVLFTKDSEGVSPRQDHIYRVEITINENANSTYSVLELYSGNLNFSTDYEHRIETHTCYENEQIQKVYFIDGLNQPRMINIAADSEEIESWATRINPFDFSPTMQLEEVCSVSKIDYQGIFPAGTIQYVLTYFNKNGQQSAPFYVSPIHYISYSNRGGSPEDNISNCFKIEAKNLDNNFDYVRAYSILRTSENGTPQCKILGDYSISELKKGVLTLPFSYLTGGTDHSESVNTPINIKSFKVFSGTDTTDDAYYEVDINEFLVDPTTSVNTTYSIPLDNGLVLAYSYFEPIEGYDADYNYLIINGTANIVVGPEGSIGPYVLTFNSSSENVVGKKWPQIIFKYDYIQEYLQELTIIDNGTIGSITDNYELLYLENESIIPKTLCEKNNTLFFGNYEYNDNAFNEEFIKNIQNNTVVTFIYGDSVGKGEEGSYYFYKNQLNDDAGKITTFKGGEIYTFGLVLQTNTGKFSSVIPLLPKENTLYPQDNGDTFKPVKASITLNNTALGYINELSENYIGAKVVLLNTTLNKVICQGVLCPTVFNKNRINNNPYTQSSWFFRPCVNHDLSTPNSGLPANKTYYNISSKLTDGYTQSFDGIYENNSEIYGASTDSFNVCDNNRRLASLTDFDYFVDNNIVTFHSPDINFERITNITGNPSLRIIGVIPITGCVTNKIYSIETPTYSQSVSDSDNYETTQDSNLFKLKIIENNTPLGRMMSLTSFTWKDNFLFDDPDTSTITESTTKPLYKYPIFPWHRQASFNNQVKATTESPWFGLMKNNISSYLKVSSFTHYLLEKKEATASEYKEAPITYYPNDIQLYNDDYNIVKLNRDINNPNFIDSKNYMASIDTVLSGKNYPTYYMDDSNNIKVTKKSDGNPLLTDSPVSIKYKSTPHAIIDLGSTKGNELIVLPKYGYEIEEELYSDNVFNVDNDITGIPFWVDSNITRGAVKIQYVIDKDSYGHDIDKNYTESSEFSLDISPGEAYTDYTITLSKDLIDHYEFTIKVGDFIIFPLWSTNINGEDYNMVWYVKHETTVGSSTYFILKPYPQDYGVTHKPWDKTKEIYNFVYTYNDVKKYIQLINIVPEVYADIDGRGNKNLYSAAYIAKEIDNTNINFSQEQLIIDSFNEYNNMYLAELYYDIPDNIQLDNSTWSTAGPATKFITNSNGMEIPAIYGDTYYQRYDCLKTYPYTLEDKNQIIEILSFMCETRVNIDGRYDKNRGLLDNTAILNTNFNLLNNAYTQKDNFFQYNYLNPKFTSVNNFANQIIWSKTKTYGELIDSWTKILPTSSLDLSGDKGEITKLINWNDNIICFQDKGFSKINYNEQAVITTTEGVPLELANSSKVNGYKYISTEVGCSNKYTVQITQSGVYFIDSITKEVYLFSNGLKCLSKEKGVSSYFNNKGNSDYVDTENNEHSTVIDVNKMHTCYDNNTYDVYFIGDDCDSPNPYNCLCYNELLGNFTSFYGYEDGYMFNYKDAFIGYRRGLMENNKHRFYTLRSDTDYNRNNNLLGKQYNSSVTIIANDNPTLDKIFTNIEYRGDVYTDNVLYNNKVFDSIEVSNEYQTTHGEVPLDNNNSKRKFREWNIDIPRVKKQIDGTTWRSTLERFRNQWVKIKLVSKYTGAQRKKRVIHDLIVKYM